MKSTAVFVAIVSAVLPCAFARTASPIAKVMELISQMQAKITAEGAEAKKVYQDYEEWCEDQARKLGFELKTEKGESKELVATIEEERATSKTLTAKVAELSETISKADEELKEATSIREKEAADFKAESSELAEVVRLVHKAIRVLKEDKQSGGSSLTQLSTASSVSQALGALVQATALTSSDAERIASLESGLVDNDAEFGAPAGAVYEKQGGGIIKTLERIADKAQTQLDKAQQEERTAIENYEVLKQSLEDEIAHAKKEMAEAKSGVAASGEEKAVAEGELDETKQETYCCKPALKWTHGMQRVTRRSCTPGRLARSRLWAACSLRGLLWRPRISEARRH